MGMTKKLKKNEHNVHNLKKFPKFPSNNILRLLNSYVSWWWLKCTFFTKEEGTTVST